MHTALQTRPHLAVVETLDFQQMVEQVEVGICISQDGVFVFVNPRFAQIHGRTPAEMLGTPYADSVHPADRARVAEIIRLRAAGKHHTAYESRSLRLDGTTFDNRVFGRSIVYRGRPAHLVTMSDISELAEAHRLAAWRARMLHSNELLCRSGSIEIDLSGGWMRLSAGAQALLGSTGVPGLTLHAALRCLPAEDRAALLACWRQAEPGRPFELRHPLRRPDGTVLQLLHRGMVEAGGPHQAPRPVAMLQDITEHSVAQAQIERLVNYHPITGLATRTRLLQRAEAAVALVSAVSPQGVQPTRPVAMLYLRVPDLARVHDRLGLDAADALAGRMAAAIARCCRAEDTVAHLRIGEFAILLDPGAGADDGQALHTATRVLAALQAPSADEPGQPTMGGQVGIARFPADAQTAELLLERAHVACQGAAGDAAIGFFTDAVGATVHRRLQLEGALQHALERNQFTLHYQPQVDLREGRIVGAEALLRWRCDELGDVSPAEFIPIAEERGLIDTIGEWVFRSACAQSAAWARGGLPAVRISVNLSPRQLEQPDISQRLQAILVETGADPHRLSIEVTESLLMRDLDSARRTLGELSALGIEIALDDFGTGYSNLAVLRALPFDVLKIDRSLVHDVTAAPEDVSLTRAVLMLAQGLKIKMLAEGVETEGQLSLLVANGCDFVQGYIFSRPVPADALAQMLRDRKQLPARFLRRQAKQRTLLLVDDEENVLSSLRRLLRGSGCQIVVARSGAEGLAKLAEHDVDVIISDQRMPNMTGVEFLRRAKALYPDTVRMVLSGYTELQSITDAVNEGAIYKFLTKPWDDERLKVHVAEAFRHKELHDENQHLASALRNANIELAQANERQQLLLARQLEQLGLEECRALNAQELLENLPTPVVGIGDDGLVAFVNHAARTLLGAARPMLGCHADVALPPDWRATWRQQDGRHRRITLDGQPHLLACAALHDGHGPRGQLLTITPDLPTPDTAA